MTTNNGHSHDQHTDNVASLANLTDSTVVYVHVRNYRVSHEKASGDTKRGKGNWRDFLDVLDLRMCTVGSLQKNQH